MSWSDEASGTQSATVNTEHTLTTVTAAADTYIFWIDLRNMQNGDVVVLRIKTKVLSSGSVGTLSQATYAHEQADEIVTSVARPGPGEDMEFTLEQTDGTGRDFDWKVSSL